MEVEAEGAMRGRPPGRCRNHGCPAFYDERCPLALSVSNEPTHKHARARAPQATVIVSLLQPTPETTDVFDDIMVSHGGTELWNWTAARVTACLVQVKKFSLLFPAATCVAPLLLSVAFT